MNVMRERRLRAAIPTQQEVAKAMGVQVSTISARLALPAEARALRARRLRRPARPARRSGGDWVKQGLRPDPHRGTRPPNPVLME